VNAVPKTVAVSIAARVCFAVVAGAAVVVAVGILR
jgi:hypothetical protein